MMDNTKDAVVEAVRADLLRRSQLGISKYGVTLERKDLNLRDWLNHVYEELLDAANYAKRSIMDVEEIMSAFNDREEQDRVIELLGLLLPPDFNSGSKNETIRHVLYAIGDLLKVHNNAR